MKETAKTGRINIGTASIVLILLILCLAVFSLLSLSDAQASLSFARRRAESVQAFYQADAKAQAWADSIRGMSVSDACLWEPSRKARLWRRRRTIIP